MLMKFNSFHLVDKSPWPLIASISAILIMFSSILCFNSVMKIFLMFSIFFMSFTSYMWWRDIHRESSVQGNHSNEVMSGLKVGMVLFISSEIFFFVSFFWTFFHSAISPTLELGQSWPPSEIDFFNPMSIPLLNTILLISSGISVTWSHHSMLKKNYESAKNSLLLTIFLGVVFSICQGFEYTEASFSISDSSFGSIFFMATGFHGLHVLMGTFFLLVSYLRFNKLVNANDHTIGFECAAWYWHFVDVVWLFLYTMVYWWGS